MQADPRLAARSFPSRVADLGFSVDLPSDWLGHELPAELPDFAQPASFAPLALVTAPHAALVFAIAARPAYDDGTLLDWATFLLQQNGLVPRAIGSVEVAGTAGLVGEAEQASELGPMLVRFAFFEDGGRLLNLTLSAPTMLADAVVPVWFAALRSLRLDTPRGSRFALDASVPGVPVVTTRAPTVAAAESSPPAASPRAELPTEEPSGLLPRSFAEFALADHAGSLDPELPINRNLRNSGAGLVPRLSSTDDFARCAIVGAGAIVARFSVPYGWHVIDDGRRTLVFEATGKVQIVLQRLTRDGRDDEAMLDALEQQMRADYPAPEFVRVRFGAIRALGARNIADGEQPLEQYHMLLPCPDDTQVLRARVTATPEKAVAACDLAELILLSCDFGPTAAAHSHVNDEQVAANQPPGDDADADAPQWYRDARALERADRCAEAEALIRASVPHAGAIVSIAELYRLRMLRLLAAGERAAAGEAFRKADAAMWYYASCSTSGGEGAARSLERDDFHRELVAGFGGEPAQAEA